MWRRTGRISSRQQFTYQSSSFQLTVNRSSSSLKHFISKRSDLVGKRLREDRSKQAIQPLCLESRYSYRRHLHDDNIHLRWRSFSSTTDITNTIENSKDKDDEENDKDVFNIFEDESDSSSTTNATPSFKDLLATNTILENAQNTISDQNIFSLLSDDGSGDGDNVNVVHSKYEEDNSIPSTVPITKKKKRYKKLSSNNMSQTPSPIKMKSTSAAGSPIDSTIMKNAQWFFDSTAPHLEKDIFELVLRRMMSFTRLMEGELKEYTKDVSAIAKRKKKKKKKKGFSDYKTLVGRINAFFMQPTKKRKRRRNNSDSSIASTKKSEVNLMLNLYPWIKPLAVNFFSGVIRDEKIPEDSTYAPYSNRKNFENNVSLLMKAREVCIKSPLLWNKNKQTQHPRNYKKECENEAENVRNNQDVVEDWHSTEDDEYRNTHEKQLGHTEYMRNTHSMKSDEILRTEAEILASTLADRLPNEAHENVMIFLKRYATAEIIAPSAKFTSEVTDDMTHEDNDPNNFIYNPLKKCAGPHTHLIASDLVEFFYIDVVDGNISENSPTANYNDMGSCTDDLRILKLRNEWNLNREALVNASIAAYNAYYNLQQAWAKDIRVEKALKAQEVKDETELESIINQVKENWEQKDEQAAKAILKGPKRINLTFQCTMLNDRFGPFSEVDSANQSYFNPPPGNIIHDVCPTLLPFLPETSKTILVDNLPIDITEEEIRLLYSRCGQVQSVEIYNLRPDLDPGELTPEQLKQKRKKTRLSGAQAAKRRGRQITPIHAMVQFKDEDGYKAATIDMLRIFGMVIRRHPSHSIPAYGLNTLYIENLPLGFTSLDLLEKLNVLFHPNMFLYLDIGSTINSQPMNCTLKFPSFEVADHAQKLLSKVDFESKDCTINWMKTPKDAIRYWRRENIDP